MDSHGLQYDRTSKRHCESFVSPKHMEGLDATPRHRMSLNERDDEWLVQCVAAQDRKAFEVLYYRHTPRLSRYLSRLVRRADVVEEIINDVMLVLWQRAGDFDGRARLSTWLFAIAHKKGLKALSKRGRQDAREAAEFDIDSVTDCDGPMRTLEQEDVARVLGEALDSLSPEHRNVVELTFYWGFSYPEIARIVDCPANTVKTRMFHARKRLKEYLGQRGLDAAWKSLVEIQ